MGRTFTGGCWWASRYCRYNGADGQFDQNYLDYYSLRAVDALEVGTNAFSCETNWQNVPLWHTSGAALSGVLGSLNISPALTESRVTDTSSSSSDSESGTLLSVPNLLPMQENGKLPDADASDAMSVRVQFDAQNATGFTYDADSKTYRMLHADGTPQLDANNGQQADFDNLLILFSASTLRDDGVTLDYDLTMGGGVWLNEGHLWNITWTQGSETTFFLYDSNGRPPDPDGRPQLSGAGVQPDRAGAHCAELHRGKPVISKETVLQSDAEPSLFTLCFLQIDHAAHFSKGGRHRAPDGLHRHPGAPQMDGLACGKVGLIDQLQRLPVRRGLAEAVEHRPPPAERFKVKAEASAAFSP